MTEASYLSTTRTAYDAVAVRYAELFGDHLADLPLDRALITAFAEFHRVLAPGGHLLLAFFQADDEPGVLTQPFDHKVTLGYRWSLDGAAEVLCKAGFIESARLSREPYEGERFPRGHLLVRKPAG